MFEHAYFLIYLPTYIHTDVLHRTFILLTRSLGKLQNLLYIVLLKFIVVVACTYVLDG
jgi:hypothetical protein